MYIDILYIALWLFILQTLVFFFFCSSSQFYFIFLLFATSQRAVGCACVIGPETKAQAWHNQGSSMAQPNKSHLVLDFPNKNSCQAYGGAHLVLGRVVLASCPSCALVFPCRVVLCFAPPQLSAVFTVASCLCHMSASTQELGSEIQRQLFLFFLEGIGVKC